MKKIFYILTLMLVAFTANAQEDIQLSCPDDNHPHAIDLGLPSGTLWACCNVEADKPEAYGGYYAWGEIEEKNNYKWSYYIHCDGTRNTCHNLGSDIAGTQYDVVHIKWGGFWFMPSKDQLSELLDYCNNEWTTVNGVEGQKFTSKANGGSIFLPAAGCRLSDHFENVGVYGYYWSSTQSSSYSYSACRLYFHSVLTVLEDYGRGSGQTIRPVISTTTNINLPGSSSDLSSQAIYNIYGIKVADIVADISTLPPGIYIQNGKKRVAR